MKGDEAAFLLQFRICILSVYRFSQNIKDDFSLDFRLTFDTPLRFQ
mgnify:CR=1 FL=1